MAVKLEIDPPDTLMSADEKLLVASLVAKVTVSVPSLVVAPSATTVPLLLVAVMVIVGPTLS